MHTCSVHSSLKAWFMLPVIVIQILTSQGWAIFAVNVSKELSTSQLTQIVCCGWIFNICCFRRWWTPLVIVKDQSSHLVYLNMHLTRQTCENLNSIGRQIARDCNGSKNTFVEQVVCFQMLEFETSAKVSNSILIFEWGITFFSDTTFFQREPFLHNVLYYQQLSINQYQVSFYADNNFEWLPIVCAQCL